MRISRKDTFKIGGYLLPLVNENQNDEKLKALIQKFMVEEWGEFPRKGDTITYLNDENSETIYNLVLKYFISEVYASEIWEDIYFEFPNISDFDADDLTNEIVNLDFDSFMAKQGERFKELYEMRMSEFEYE